MVATVRGTEACSTRVPFYVYVLCELCNGAVSGEGAVVATENFTAIHA